MSGGSTAQKGFVERLAQLGALFVVFGVMFVSARAMPSESAGSIITALGFLLLSGMLASALLEVLGLPHLTGYLLAGIVSGPNVLHLVDHQAVDALAPVNTLALALIALAGGTELRIDLLKQVLRTLLVTSLVQQVMGMVCVGLAFLAITRFLPFTHGLETSALIGLALLWSVLGICRSPSATLGIFAQLRPDGPLARFSLAFVMTSDVIVATTLTVAIAFAKPLIEPLSGLSIREFTALGHELLGSISLGTTLGLVLSLYLWLVGSNLLVVLIAIGFGLTEGLHYLRFEPLLAFMVAGFVVQNFSQQGHKLLSAVNRTGDVVYVVFFATAGAHLDIPLVRQLWPVALYLGGVRFLTIWVSHRVAMRFVDEEPVVRRWGWSSLVSQAGLTIGMAVIVERSFPSFGAGFRSLAIANVALNELVGPVLFKFALDRTGESGKGAVEGAALEEERVSLPPARPAHGETT